MNTQKILTTVDTYKDELIDEIAKIVAIPSVSEDVPKTKEALRHALALAKRLGLKAESYCDDTIGLIDIGEGSETVGILAHVDVVPVEGQPGWETDPYKLEIKDGKMYGRGVEDDKGPAIMSMYAMKALMDAGVPLKKKIRLILGTQEEIEWTDFYNFYEVYKDRLDEFMPDYGFTPDSGYPICNIGKGCIDSDLVFPFGDKGGAAENEDGWEISKLEAGIMGNGIPERAACTLSLRKGGEVVEEKEIECTGKAVHSSMPEGGVNANFLLADELEAFAKAAGEDGKRLAASPLYRLLLRLKELFQDLYGQALDLASESEYYEGEFVHKNCFSPTMIRQRDGVTIIHLNTRPAYGFDTKKILKRYEELAAEFGGTHENVDELKAIFVSAGRPWIKILAESYEEVTGLENEFILDYGASYAQAMPNIVVWGPVFPYTTETCHEPNECYGVDDMMKCVKMMALALGRIAETEESLK